LCLGFGLSSLTDGVCTLDGGGVQTFTLLIGDHQGSTSAGYELYLHPISPANATPIGLDTVVSGVITPAIEFNAYTFSGTAGERIRIRVRDTSDNSFFSGFWLYRPNGTLLCSEFGLSLADSVCTLDGSGVQTFTLLIGDFPGSTTSGYKLYLQRPNNPANPTSITFGQTLTGAIVNPPELNAYTFNGVSGAQVQVTMTETSSSLEPELHLYRPDGTLLFSDFGNTIATVQGTLDINGTYTILAGDNGGEDTGGYTLNLQ
jgi:hypothetical protein